MDLSRMLLLFAGQLPEATSQVTGNSVMCEYDSRTITAETGERTAIQMNYTDFVTLSVGTHSLLSAKTSSPCRQAAALEGEFVLQTSKQLHLPMEDGEGTIPRMLRAKASSWRWLGVASILLLFVAILMLAPAEKTLGETIRWVYAHVAFTKAGMYAFYIAGLLGAIVLVTDNRNLQTWAHTIAWVAFGMFLIGGVFSIFAQRASWGGLPLAEPRNRTTLQVLAVAIVALVLAGWVPEIRVRGLLYLLLAGYVAWVIPNTPLVLHPANAGGSSPSMWIRWTFPVLTGLALLLGMWVVWYFHGGRHYD